jgi:hypothetical protein
MNPLGYVVVPLMCLASPVTAAQVYAGCASPSPTFRHVWYFDPLHGKTLTAGGNGSNDRPLSSGAGAGTARGGGDRPKSGTDRAG